jgi:lysophospholipid acyltransferase (LPLAT)-like uncharacterized protein
MKLRHPLFKKLAGAMLSGLLRSWQSTISISFHSLSSHDVEPRHDNLDRYLYSIWHEDLAIMTAQYGGPHMCPLVSEHTDGQLLSEASRHLRMRCVPGSSTRGGIRAIRELLRQKNAHLVVTPDGPRGPRQVVKQGLIYLASRSGLPIVPLCAGYRRAWRLRTWDQLAIPCPFSKVYCVGGAPIAVPADLDRNGLERYRLLVQEAMDFAHARVTWRAERRSRVRAAQIVFDPAG